MKRFCCVILIVSAMIMVVATASDNNRPILGPDVWPAPGDPSAGEHLLGFKKPVRMYENAYTGLMFFTKDGWKFVSNVFLFKLGPQYKWGITLSAADAQNNYYLGKAELDIDKVEFDSESAEFSYGESFIKGRNPNYHVRYVTDNISVDLHIKSRVGIWAQAGDGKFKLDPNGKWFFHAAFGAPWADITGTMTIDGKTHKIDGQGYLDHGHWSVPFNRHNPIWEGFIAWTWEPVDGHMYAMQIFDYVTHPAYGGKRLATAFVVRDNEFICTTPKFKISANDFRRHERTGAEFPWKFSLRTMPDAPCTVEGVAITNYPWEVLDIFDELPAYIRPIVKKFLKRPLYFRGFGEFRGRVKCGDEEILLHMPAFTDANYVK